MDALMPIESKRHGSSLVPYRTRDDSFEFFLQKRDSNTSVNPNMFGLFGGGREGGETPEETLVREIQEELEYTTAQPVFFSRYETARTVFSVFIEEVDASFESTVTVLEGEYGKFLSLKDIQAMQPVSSFARIVIAQLDEHLSTSRRSC